jgi:hypothetical protein
MFSRRLGEERLAEKDLMPKVYVSDTKNIIRLNNTAVSTLKAVPGESRIDIGVTPDGRHFIAVVPEKQGKQLTKQRSISSSSMYNDLKSYPEWVLSNESVEYDNVVWYKLYGNNTEVLSDEELAVAFDALGVKEEEY